LEQDSLIVDSHGFLTVYKNPTTHASIEDLINVNPAANGLTTIMASLSLDNNNAAASASIWNGTSLVESESASSSGLVTLDSGSVLASLGANGNQDLDIIIGDGTTFCATNSDQIVIATGESDVLQAGANDVTLSALGDIGGTNLFQAGTYSSVTEIVVSAGVPPDMNVASVGESDAGGEIPPAETDPSTNVFSFSTGTNVLIGDLGSNTFVMAPRLTSGVNIIWGGGGTSTYDDLYGNIVILKTSETPTDQQIESLASDIAQLTPTQTTIGPWFGGLENETSNGVAQGVPTSFIIDPSSSDSIAGYSGTYVPTGFPFFAEGTEFDYAVPGEATTTDGLPVSGQYFPVNGDDLIYSNGLESDQGVFLYNFVNDDLGITYSGDLPLVSAGWDNVITGQSGTYFPVIPSKPWVPSGNYSQVPGNVFSYNQGETIDLGGSTSGSNFTEGSSNFVAAGVDPIGDTVTSGGSQSLMAGGSATNTVIGRRRRRWDGYPKRGN
jgi:hypothetical protein